jgi:hypothetical protein
MIQRIVRSAPQLNKINKLPVGVSMTWRTRTNRKPYLEYLVNWVDETGKPRIKHFYVGVTPTAKKKREARQAAIQFRKAYEKSLSQASQSPAKPQTEQM